MKPQIAMVGMACRYPDAASPHELWQNVLAKRQAFRQLPAERLRAADYVASSRTAPDRTYSSQAAVISGYEFDRVGFRVAGSTFRSADMAHWLALDVASQALADAGFPDGRGLPLETTGVVIGNTLTGEFSRANVMRLRWPYVRRVVEASLAEEGWTEQRCASFLRRLEGLYKAPFPGINEETLAGGLSNTIAGRICNHFDLKGGGYTVDGACASSLLAATTAFTALAAGELDVMLVGGVDLSLDPFELVGFAKAGALAGDEMRVYDERSAGFWPGEGCGFVVFMRAEDAEAESRRVYAKVRGWGVSSDGSGGITRPEVAGQLLALRRAYRRASAGIETVAYFEGHGTGTNVGDTTELKALKQALGDGAAATPPPALGSVKANIGHTKAAAGMAGLIKATMAVYTQILPPTTGCHTPHAELKGGLQALRVLEQGEPWPAQAELRAAVSAMGFGGINTHVLIEGASNERRASLSAAEQRLLSSAQDAELFLLGDESAEGLRRQVEHLLTFAARLSRSELIDLAATLEKRLGRHEFRAAVVASTPLELAANLETLRARLAEGANAHAGTRIDVRAGVFHGAGSETPRVGFLFPGQGSPAHLDGGMWRQRFSYVRDLFTPGLNLAGVDPTSTTIAQPAIVKSSLAALHVLNQIGLKAEVGVGHSLGELTALHWAGALGEAALQRVAAARGRAMGELGDPTGTMASIAAEETRVRSLLNGERVVIAGLNSPSQTVISGTAAEVATVLARAGKLGLEATPIAVSHAFHSPLVAAAAPRLARHLSEESFEPVRHTIISTVTGKALGPDEDLRAILYSQVTQPVRFIEALRAAAAQADLFIEVGPGRVLSRLAAKQVGAPAVALDAGGDSLRGLLKAVGAAYALGAPVHHQALFADRFARPFELDWRPQFFVNPCEKAPAPGAGQATEHWATEAWAEDASQDAGDAGQATDGAAGTSVTGVLELVRSLVAERAELPCTAVQDESRLLDDLHLNSISVGQIVVEAAKALGLPRPTAPNDYATATLAEVAQSLESLAATAGEAGPQELGEYPPGVASWVRTFNVELVERERARSRAGSGEGAWQVLAPPQNHTLADSLRAALVEAKRPGGGCVVCLPPEPDERQIGLLLEAARSLLDAQQQSAFVLVQHGGGVASFARSLHLEMPQIDTCVVDVPPEDPRAVEWVVAEATSASGYVEVYYDEQGRRREPVLCTAPEGAEAAEMPLGADDVLLVTGGGKGIAAECAAMLARQTGARLALVGRAQPSADPALAANLERFAAEGIRFGYYPADVTDAEGVRRAVAEAEAALGPVTAVLHGAGKNEPRLLRQHVLDAGEFLATVRTKVDGARNVLAAIDQSRLRLFVAFGSIIARTGMRGEADYALANEWLTRLTERLQKEQPGCRCLSVEWSVWSGVGMGERLGRVDALMREGISPITPDAGLEVMRRLLTHPPAGTSVIVGGRFGKSPTLGLRETELPLLRFLERPRVFYPGIELVVESQLSAETDLYLNDHVFHGAHLFPAVMGLEAMAQAAMALVSTSSFPVLEELSFARPVTVSNSSPTVIRIAALAHGPSLVEVVLRSEETDFQIDHFRALCRFDEEPARDDAEPERTEEVLPPVPLDPERDLYDGLLFQGQRFRRLRGYRRLSAHGCTAEVAPDGDTAWFSQYLPGELVLGDPAARDATIHALQSCVPHATILPVGVECLRPCVKKAPGPWLVKARERSHEGSSFVYDVDVVTLDGVLLERWQGMKLQVVETGAPESALAGPLLGPYIERKLREFNRSSNVRVAVDRNDHDERRVRTERAIQRALGESAQVRRRPDGKPEVAGPPAVSSTHAGDLTMAVAGDGPLSCDIEPVEPRTPDAWRGLLGAERYVLAGVIAREAGEDDDAAATRVWVAGECLKKAGAAADAPLVLVSPEKGGWVNLASGPLAINTLVTRVRDFEHRLGVAVLAGAGRGD
jgi:enediyne polyketide synthase